MSTDDEQKKSEESASTGKKRLTFDFIKTSRERVTSLIPDWGKTPTNVLQNLVAFAIDAIDYASERHLRAFVPGKGKLFESLDYYQRLGEELVYTAYTMNLPEPRLGNISAWVMDAAYASLRHKSLKSTVPQSNVKHLLDRIIIGDAFIEYCKQRSIDVEVEPGNAHVLLGDVISKDKFAIIGKKLVKHCEKNGIDLPTSDNLPDWFEKNIRNPNQSDLYGADYVRILDFLKEQKLLGNIVVITSNTTNICYHTNDLLLPTRGILKPYQWNGFDYSISWRNSRGGIAQLENLQQLLQSSANKCVRAYEYDLQRPDTAIVQYSTDYYLCRDFLGDEVRVGVSRPQDYQILEEPRHGTLN